MRITIPDPSLVILIGASGSGKSTFAVANFQLTEVISSDDCRALISDDPSDMSATDAAFEVLHLIASKRLEHGRLTVIDATNVRPEFRAPLIRMAARHRCPAIAVVLDMPSDVCRQRNASRADRAVASHVVRNHLAQLRSSLDGIGGEGFQQVFVLRSPEDVAAADVVRVAAAPDGRVRGRSRRPTSASHAEPPGG